MTIEVLLFAQLRDALGEAHVRVDAGAGTTAGEFAHAFISDRFGDRFDSMPIRIAVNETVVAEDHILQDGDRLALLTPVSGG